MKVFIDGEERRFYKENGYVGFDPFLPEGKLLEVWGWIQSLLAKRLKTFERNIPLLSEDKLILEGRDLWRGNSGILRFEQNRTLAEAAADLFGHKQLVLGFDQYFPAEKILSTIEHRSPYGLLYPEEMPLEDLISVQGLLGAAVICLRGTSSNEEAKLPRVPGGITFISARGTLPVAELQQNRDCDYLMIGYALHEGTYVFKEKDPNTHAPKKHGLGFGDLLIRKGHPFLWG